MPINKRGGKGHKRGKRMTNSSINTALTYKDTTQNQEYARVIATLGDCRLSVELIGVEPASTMYNVNCPLICKIPGAFRKKIFINKGDYVLVSVREYQKDHVDVITKYSHSEALTLMKQGEIPMDDGLPSGGNDDGPDFEIVVGAEGEPVSKQEDTVKVVKDENWYNSLLPPNSDSDSNSDSEDEGKNQKNHFTLNTKGTKVANKNQNQNALLLSLNIGNPNAEMEEIDLETL